MHSNLSAENIKISSFPFPFISPSFPLFKKSQFIIIKLVSIIHMKQLIIRKKTLKELEILKLNLVQYLRKNVKFDINIDTMPNR